MGKYDITGQQFGYWTALGRDTEYVSKRTSKWICQCECGTIKSVFKGSLLSGRSKSCGCHRHDNSKGINATHGMSGTRIHHEWLSMRRRCAPNSVDSKNYYDRGISVCPEWERFEPFYQWAIENGYNDSLSLDRIDNNSGYCPENCQWIPIEEQQGNKTNTVYVTYEGEQYCLRTLCRKIGFPYKTAHRRLQRMRAKGKPIDTDKLFEPIHKDRIAFRYRK